MADDDKPSKVDDKLDELKRKAAVAAAKKTLEKTGHELLDGVERWLFGKVGGAEEVLREEAGRGSGLDRLREEADAGVVDEELDGGAVSGAEKRRAEREARRAAALAELEAIKKRLEAGEDQPGDEAEEDPVGDDAPPTTTGSDAPPPPLRRSRKTKRRL